MTSDGFDKTADAGTHTTRVALVAGGQLGKYRLDRVLGEGGMGVVWAAHDPDLERAVAIKVLRFAQAAPQLRQRLLREARAMAKLKHPNVLTVYEVGTAGDRDYIAMELVEGTSLDHWLAANPPHEEVWNAVLASGRGLAAAHDAGVVHRDFKPHNVLRSREGRVLVTDFGLARGLLRESDSAAIDAAPALEPSITPFDITVRASRDSRRANDSVLDSPLTQTGALIGTPAYMAPEQYAGADPDPRTDQFAFCVTAWQALTGDRPFKGQSLEEMCKSASAGVAHIVTKMPGAVRAVLERGLAAKPDARWPSLDALLDALDHAGKQPARRRRTVVGAGAVAIGAAIIATSFAINRKQEKAKTGCDDPEAQFAEAWSPALREELERSSRGDASAFARVAGAFDQVRERWLDSYGKTCRAPAAKTFAPRIACLHGIRDQVSALTYLFREADARIYQAFDPYGALPNVTSCDGASPTAPPAVPAEQPRRKLILTVLARSFALRAVPPDELDRTVEALLAEAKQLGWVPLVPAVLVASGHEYLRRHDVTRARDHYRRALAFDHQDNQRDVRMEANARLGLLEASMKELENPGTRVPPNLRDATAKPVPHEELSRLLVLATAASNKDPMLAGARGLLAAHIYADLGQFNRYRHAYGDALQAAAEARKQFDAIGDVKRAAQASVLEAWIDLARGDDRALDDALFAARRAADALEAAQLPAPAGLDDIRAFVAFARRDYDEVHRIYDRMPHVARTADSPVITGRIVPAEDKALVVAWRGDLVGDPQRLYTDPRSVVVGDIAQTEHDGTFTIRAQPGWVIAAESSQGSSQLQVIGRTSPTLDIKPVKTISGTVRGRNLFGTRAFARVTAGASRWILQVPIEKDASFDLRGLPAGAAVFGITGQAGTGTRTIVAGADPREMTWPHGEAIELVVRAKAFDDAAHAWLVRGKHAVSTRADLDALVASAADVATSALAPIGSDNTDAGREVYRAGDRHAVITGIMEGDYTACVAVTDRVTCKVVAAKKTLAIEYSDGRFASGMTPILFEL